MILPLATHIEVVTPQLENGLDRDSRVYPVECTAPLARLRRP